MSIRIPWVGCITQYICKKCHPSKEAFFLTDKLTGFENQFSYRKCPKLYNKVGYTSTLPVMSII